MALGATQPAVAARAPGAEAAVAIAFAALAVVAVCWMLAGIFLVRSLRVRPRAARLQPTGRGWPIDLLTAAGLASLVPWVGMWERLPPPPLVAVRAALAVVLALAAAGLAGWEWSTRRRYLDRSPAAASRARFLTYGPYRHVRRPRELAVVLLVVATSLALPEWWRPVVALLVFAPAMAFRARRAECAEAPAFGEEFESYRRAVPLLAPVSRKRAGPVSGRS